MGVYQIVQKLGLAPAIWQLDTGDYNGLSMRCAPGTHAAAMELIRRHQFQPVSTIELAAGSGAMLARLRDHGYTDLAAVELDQAKFGVPGVVPSSFDLNLDFAGLIGRRFGLVVAIEIIEHLNSPRHFLSQIRELLEDDGLLLLSTPNIADWLGRLKFFATGELRYFDEEQYNWNHHVSPIPEVQLRHMFREIGLQLVDQDSAGSFFGPLKRVLTSPLRLVCGALMGRSAVGDVKLYLARRVVPKPSRANDWTTSDGTISG